MDLQTSWARFKQYFLSFEELGLGVDLSRMSVDAALFDDTSEKWQQALDAMDALEKGGVANVDENRMVGHYWLRSAELAPEPAIVADIQRALQDIQTFVADVHGGVIRPPAADGFFVVLVIGVGGSVLGPQMVAHALSTGDDPMVLRFIDNTDPQGIDQCLSELEDSLGQTMTVVMSKSGTTAETRNAMMEVAAAYDRAGLDFARHAVAVTAEGSVLHEQAQQDRWLRTFPVWDWVGGRTSLFSPVGMLPAALLGVDIDAMLRGASDCDAVTRRRTWRENPAMTLAALWHDAVHRRSLRQLVIMPYADRLELFAKYLQQLIMESLGKKTDRAGQTVHEGLTVFGNKGSTDQHSYVQQLLDGPNNFFVTFVNVLQKGRPRDVRVEEGITSGDYLSAFWQGTREALSNCGRDSITLTINALDARSLGVLIALFERTVGFYAELANINAYHQPAVELGKKAAGRSIELQRKVAAHFLANADASLTAEELARAMGEADVESVYHVLSHMAASEDHAVSRLSDRGGVGSTDSKFGAAPDAKRS